MAEIDWSFWLAKAGYLAVFFGTALEGESVLLFAVWLGEQGIFSPLPLFFVALAGAVTGDHLFFRLGRHGGISMLERSARLKRRLERFRSIMERHQYWLMASFRLVPGSRIIVPLTLGSSGVRPALFFVFDLIGCTIWAAVLVKFGLLLLGTLRDLQRTYNFHELAPELLLFSIVLLTLLYHLRDFGYRVLFAASKRISGVS